MSEMKTANINCRLCFWRNKTRYLMKKYKVTIVPQAKEHLISIRDYSSKEEY